MACTLSTYCHQLYITPCRLFHSLHSFCIRITAFLVLRNFLCSCRTRLYPLYLRCIVFALLCQRLNLTRSNTPRITAWSRITALLSRRKRVRKINLLACFCNKKNKMYLVGYLLIVAWRWHDFSKWPITENNITNATFYSPNNIFVTLKSCIQRCNHYQPVVKYYPILFSFRNASSYF